MKPHICQCEPTNRVKIKEREREKAKRMEKFRSAESVLQTPYLFKFNKIDLFFRFPIPFTVMVLRRDAYKLVYFVCECVCVFFAEMRYRVSRYRSIFFHSFIFHSKASSALLPINDFLFLNFESNEFIRNIKKFSFLSFPTRDSVFFLHFFTSFSNTQRAWDVRKSAFNYVKRNINTKYYWNC